MDLETKYPYIVDNIHYESKSDYIMTVKLGFCGCGMPYKAISYLRQYLHNISKEIYPKKIDGAYHFLAYWADNKGYTEHGSGVLNSWLTNEGEILLNELNEMLGIENKYQKEL